ncbi:alpha carbonic anhydrase [Rhexocercosporidium sp. MPI-PUGE-AT-0058]|nr:alpha carbonic anhydrase [Rhexocercosporidium sp. MPI-PUGE-AT-0058]
MFRTLVSLVALGSVLGCPEHTPEAALRKRADENADEHPLGATWSFANQAAWSTINSICSTGTMQSPINLSGAFSKVYAPTFKYSVPALGALSNWGYGPSYTLNGTSGAPTFTTSGTEYFLLGFHTHTPSDHTINNKSAPAELHLVHGDATGAPKGVLGFPLSVGAKSAFFAQILGPEGAPNTTSKLLLDNHQMDMSLAVKEGGNFKSYWTYKGSLTTPPCTEGKRWWVSGKSLTVSQAQMDELMSISEDSARAVQKIQAHDVGKL